MNHQTTTSREPGYLFGDDYEDAAFNPPAPLSTEEIKRKAHIVNGGEAEFRCPKCGGSGRYGNYGSCFKCSGSGKVGKRVAAAAKGKETKQRNIEAWQDEHRAEIAYVHKRADKGSTFYAGFVEGLTTYGTLTERQLEMVQRDIAKDEEFWAKKRAEREAAAPVVPTQAIEALFAKATEKLAKTAIFRTTEITIKKAPATGAEPRRSLRHRHRNQGLPGQDRRRQVDRQVGHQATSPRRSRRWPPIRQPRRSNTR